MKFNFKDSVQIIVSAVKLVEANCPLIAGIDKKAKAVEIINEKIDIPFLNESMEAKLFELAIDVAVCVFNETIWNKD